MDASLETPAQLGHIRSGLASVTNATLQVMADGQEMGVGLDGERLEPPLLQSIEHMEHVAARAESASSRHALDLHRPRAPEKTK